MEPEEEALLRTLVESSRSVPRDQRGGFLVLHMDNATLVRHAGLGTVPLDEHALRDLEDRGFIRVTNRRRNAYAFDLRKEALGAYEALMESLAGSIEFVATEAIIYVSERLTAPPFDKATEQWRRAQDMLWTDNPSWSEVGHNLREAMMSFAGAAVALTTGQAAEGDPAKTVDRIRAALARGAAKRSDSLAKSLVAIWGTASDLVQRLEHGAAKEGEELTFEDARAAVFAVAFAMSEIARTL